MNLSQIPFAAETVDTLGQGEFPVEPPRLTMGSPFAIRFEQGEASTPADPHGASIAALATELQDEEFDEAVSNLIACTRHRHHRQMASGLSRHGSEQALVHHFRQLEAEAQTVIDGLESMPQAELLDEQAADGYEQLSSEPEFDQFLGGLKKKLKKLAQTGLNLAGKFLAGPLWSKIKALVPKLLRAVLAKAIGKLDPRLQAAARQVASRLGIRLPAAPRPRPAVAAPAPMAVAAAPESATDPDPAQAPVQDIATVPDDAIQSEFDTGLAEAFLGEDHEQWDQGFTAFEFEPEAPSELGELEDARETLASEIEALKDGESSAPVIDNFVPALLPVLKVGMKLIGRPKVVNAISKIVAQLISKLTGPAMAPALSRAIVDTGLRAMSLETGDDHEAHEDRTLGASALAATVEETIARVASLPEHVLDNEMLLETSVVEAFERAAAANLPALFPVAVYSRRPGLLEGGLNVAWIHKPGRGRRRYKKCSRTFNVSITPEIASEIESFEGATLAEYLAEQEGVPEGETVEGELHLYEAIAGTTAGDIAAGEAEDLEAEGGPFQDEEQLHPLTGEAASRLFGAASLGRRLHGHASRHRLPAGQRLYRIALRRRPGISIHMGGQQQLRNRSRLSLALDANAHILSLRLYLAEATAQKIAAALRRKEHPGAVASKLRALMGRRIKAILAGNHRMGLRIKAPGVTPGPATDAARANLLKVLPPQFAGKLLGWTDQAVLDLLSRQAATVLAAADQPDSGVTLMLRLNQPPALAELASALSGGGQPDAIARALEAGAAPRVTASVTAGRRHG